MYQVSSTPCTVFGLRILSSPCTGQVIFFIFRIVFFNNGELTSEKTGIFIYAKTVSLIFDFLCCNNSVEKSRSAYFHRILVRTFSRRGTISKTFWRILSCI